MSARSFLDKALTILIASILLVTVGLLLYTVTKPQLTDRFTEFYLLNLEGEAGNYPQDLKVGEEGTVLVSIVNHEKETASYELKVLIDGVQNYRLDAIQLASEEKWEQAVGFVPDKTGDRQKVEFLLFKFGQSEPYLTLHLWINVTR